MFKREIIKNKTKQNKTKQNKTKTKTNHKKRYTIQTVSIYKEGDSEKNMDERRKMHGQMKDENFDKKWKSTKE